MKKVITAVIVIVLVIIGTVVVLGMRDNGGVANRPEEPSSTGVQNNTPSVSESSTIIIDNMSFNPISLVVKKGTKVTWTNQDSTPHSIKGSESNAAMMSGTLQNGDSYDVTFNEVGSFSYMCGIHPSMSGNVVVIE
jgi:plastocyanin